MNASPLRSISRIEVPTYSVPLALLLLLLSLGTPSEAEQKTSAARLGALQNEQGPYICHGYTPGEPEFVWKPRQLNDVPFAAECPQGFAFYAVNTFGEGAAPAAQIGLTGMCCRLPFDDILTSEHHYVLSRCPESSVVTGFRATKDLSCAFKASSDEQRANCSSKLFQMPKELRCTMINTDKYRLATAAEGRSVRLTEHFRRVLTPIYPLSSIPAAIRYSVGRMSRYHWDYASCIGYPWGSLLTARVGKSCELLEFRQLHYRESKDEGGAVQMFPACESISDPLDPDAYCIP